MKLYGDRKGSSNPKGTIIGEADNQPHVTQQDIANELGVHNLGCLFYQKMELLSFEIKIN